MHKALMTVVAGVAASLSMTSGVLAAPMAQAAACPVAADDVIAGAVGAPAQILDPDFGVTVDGTDTECLFTAGGSMVLVRREANYFADSSAAGVTPEQAEQLRLLIRDELDYVPVGGVGDAALWATVRDRSLAPERMAVLISKRGADVFTIGVMDKPDALDRATTLTRAVFAAQAP